MSENSNLPAVPSAVDTEIAEINSAMADRNSDYWRGPKGNDGETLMASRYRSLIEAKESGTAPPSGPSSAAKEKAALELLMGDSHSEYWKGPMAEKNQARYLQILEAEEAGKALPSMSTKRASLTAQEDAAVAAFNALDPGEQAEHLSFWQSPGGQEIIEGWERMGGVMKNAQAADALVADLKSGLPAESVDGFEWEVSELPIAVQIGMSAELAHPYLPPSVSASREEVGFFSTTEEGADLIREWGTSAARNVGVIRARLRRISDRLSAPNQESFANFIKKITPDEFKIIARFLVR